MKKIIGAAAAINALVCVHVDETTPGTSVATDFAYLAGKGVK